MARGPKQGNGTDGAPTDATHIFQQDGAQLPSGLEPWNDKALPPTERLEAYRTFLHEKLAATLAAVDACQGDVTKQLEIRDAPETQRLMKEAAWVKEASAEEFCERMRACTPRGVAEAMVASYRFDKSTGVSTFTIPAGVSDIEAMRAVNEYYSKRRLLFERDAIYAKDFSWYENNLPDWDMTQPREVAITAVVEGTRHRDRATQSEVLASRGLRFADVREQALAAALHACVTGQDLFGYCMVRGAVSGLKLTTDLGVGISLYVDDGLAKRWVAASGSPVLE